MDRIQITPSQREVVEEYLGTALPSGGDGPTEINLNDKDGEISVYHSYSPQRYSVILYDTNGSRQSYIGQSYCRPDGCPDTGTFGVTPGAVDSDRLDVLRFVFWGVGSEEFIKAHQEEIAGLVASLYPQH